MAQALRWYDPRAVVRNSVRDLAMLSAALWTLALLPQEARGEIVHAPLHDLEADLLIEVPNVQGALGALDTTASARLWRDPVLENVRAALGLEETALDPGGLVAQALRGWGLPRETARAGAALLRELERVSVSAHGVTGPRPSSREAAQRIRAAVLRLREIELELARFRERNGGRDPARLEELWGAEESPTGRQVDPWGYFWNYRISHDGQPPRIGSWGSDGRRGGSFEAADLTARSDVDHHIGALGFATLGAQVVLEFRDESASRRALEFLRESFIAWGGAPSAPAPIGSLAAGPAELLDLGLPGLPEVSPWLLQAGRWVVFAGGAIRSEAFVERASLHPLVLATRSAVKRPSTDQEETGPTVLARGRQSAGTWSLLVRLLRGRPRGSSLEDSFWSELDPWLEAWPASGPRTWQLSLEAGRYAWDIDLDLRNLEHGRVFGGEPWRETMPNWLRPDAMAFVATTVDARALGEAVLNAFAQRTGRTLESWESELEREVGMRASTHLLGPLGSRVHAHLGAPSVMLIPPHGLYLELEDPPAFHAALDAMIPWLEDQLPETMSVRRQTYRGWSLVELEGIAVGGRRGPSFLPCLAVLGDHVLLGLNSAYVTIEIQRWERAREAEPPGSEVSEWYASQRDAGKEFAELAYMDWPRLFESVEQLVSVVSRFGDWEVERVLERAGRPRVALWTQHLQPTWQSTIRTTEGVHVHRESSLGPDLWLGLPLVWSAASAEARPVPREAAKPDTGRQGGEPATNHRSLTRTELEDLHEGLSVYRLESGRFPEQLEQLTESTDNFPRGFLGGPRVPHDAWQHEFVYRVEPDGASYQLYSKGPDGRDDGGGGDDVTDS